MLVHVRVSITKLVFLLMDVALQLASKGKNCLITVLIAVAILYHIVIISYSYTITNKKCCSSSTYTSYETEYFSGYGDGMLGLRYAQDVYGIKPAKN